MTDGTDDLKRELLRAERSSTQLKRLDILLRRKQEWWEHPRNFALILGVLAALVGAGAGLLGYKIGSAPPQQIIVHLDQPLTVKP